MITVDKLMPCDLMAAIQHPLLQLDLADSLIQSGFLAQSDFIAQSKTILRSDSLAQGGSFVRSLRLHTILTCKQLVSHEFLA